MIEFQTEGAELLAVTNLETLESRRLCADLGLVMCYKIVFSLVNVDFGAFFRFAPSNITGTRSHRYKFFVEQSNHNVRYYFFSRRVVNPWNNLYQLILIFHLLLGLKLY